LLVKKRGKEDSTVFRFEERGGGGQWGKKVSSIMSLNSGQTKPIGASNRRRGSSKKTREREGRRGTPQSDPRPEQEKAVLDRGKDHRNTGMGGEGKKGGTGTTPDVMKNIETHSRLKPVVELIKREDQANFEGEK